MMRSKIHFRSFVIPIFFLGALSISTVLSQPEKSFPSVSPSFWKMKLATLAGDTVPIASLKGKYLLLNFWGEWCGKCQEELPFLAKLQGRYAKSGLHIIGFLKSENRAKALKLLKSNNAEWMQIPLNDDVEKMFGVKKFPTNLLISPDGKIVMEGFSNHYQDFKKRMEALGPGSDVKKNEIKF